MEVVLVRHTRVAVAKGMCYGQSDVDVADTFRQEAAATRIALHERGPFDRAFTSPLSRARRLAEFCGFEDAVADDRLMEMSMGRWEMQMYDDIADPYLQEWYADYMRLPTPGGESFVQLCQRVSAFLDWLKTQPYRRVAVFSHAGVLVCAGIYGRLFGADEAWSHVVDYGGMETIEI